MGKWGFRAKDMAGVSETAKDEIKRILEDFNESDDRVYTFEANLSKQHRAVVHLQCRKKGMTSKSFGKGNQRHVVVYKTDKKKDKSSKPVEGKRKTYITPYAFSEDSKRVLMDLFMHYPPVDDQTGEQNLNEQPGNTHRSQGRRDDIFLRPRMSKEEIAKKMKLLASKIEKTPKLKEISRKRSQLPIASFQGVITSTVVNHQVVLICGETGCGKTTQVPQYLLDYMWANGEACKVVCTQPRRISAISVSERISQERGEDIGESVGYKIRLEAKGGRQSSILFCTSGVLLRVLVSSRESPSGASNIKAIKYISELTHIVVDEIHERDRYSDFMLTILRDLLPAYPHLRLVLMSATIDAERFSEYFGGCPIIRVPGFTHPVKTFYLEEVLSILRTPKRNHLNANTSSDCPQEELKLSEEYKVALDEAIEMSSSNEEFDSLLELISSEKMPEVLNYQHSSTGVTPLMVFAGKGRVDNVCTLLSLGADSCLQAHDGRTALDWAKHENQTEAAEIIKQHMDATSSGSMEEERLLKKYMENVNPDLIDYVLIEQLLKKVCKESKDGAILVFLPGWEEINKTQKTLLANSLFKNSSKFLVLPLHSMVPAVEQKKVFQRPPQGCRKIILSTNIAETSVTIDDVVYVIDSGRMKEKGYDPYNNVSTLKSSWISKASAKQREGRAGRCQPGVCYHLYSKLKAVSLADFQEPEIKRMPIEELCLQVKMLDPNCKVDEFLKKTLDPPVLETINNAIAVLQDIGALSLDEQLTELGMKLGCLPVHPITSKMLFSSILLNCLDPALTLACVADYRDPFTLPMLPNDKNRADVARAKLGSLYGGYSDQLAIVAAFDCWRSARNRGLESWFCSEYFVSPSTMHMLSGMRTQLLNELKRGGFVHDDVSTCSVNAKNPGILHAVIVAGLYPGVGRLRRHQKAGKAFFVETGSGKKAQLLSRSLISKVPFDELFKKSDEGPLVMYDEVTRGDGGLHIRKCTVIGPFPLLLFAKEIAVVPGEEKKDDTAQNDDKSDTLANGDGEGGDKGETGSLTTTSEHGERIMRSPNNTVTVVVDGWLSFRLKALEVAQIYCLRERLCAAILCKISNPRMVLPPPLEASIYTVACLMAYDGMSGISLPAIKPAGDIWTTAANTKRRGVKLAGDIWTPSANTKLGNTPTQGRYRGGYCLKALSKPSTNDPAGEILPLAETKPVSAQPSSVRQPQERPASVPLQKASKKRKRKNKSKKQAVEGESQPAEAILPPGQTKPMLEQPPVTTSQGPITGSMFVEPPSVQTTLNKKRKRKNKPKTYESQHAQAVSPPVRSTALERPISGPASMSPTSAPVRAKTTPNPVLGALVGSDSSHYGPYGPRGR